MGSDKAVVAVSPNKAHPFAKPINSSVSFFSHPRTRPQFIIQSEMNCLNETTVTNEFKSDCGSRAITDVSTLKYLVKIANTCHYTRP